MSWLKRAAITATLTGLAMAGMAATNLVPASGQVAPHLNGDWTITLKVAIATGGVVLPAAFTLGVIFTRFKASIERVTERLADGDQRFQSIEGKIDRLTQRLDLMPCPNGEACALDRHAHRKS